MKDVWRAADRSFRPWKNGGGETAEILVAPEGSGIDGFDWRLSTAVVASDGPFSVFPGVDRVLTVIEGGPMLLQFGGEEHLLTEESPPFAFAGDQPCSARLTGPALLDFNVMLRRGLRAEVTRGPLTMPPAKTRAAYALLLEPGAGLERLDLVDLYVAPELAAPLSGIPAISIAIFG